MTAFIAIIVLLVLEIIACTIAVVAMALFLYGAFTTRVPFVPMPRYVVDALVREAPLHSGDTLYDLGSGDGRVVFSMAAAYKNARAVGIEKAPLPYFISRVRSWILKLPNAEIRRENFINTSLTKATHVFTYLFPEIMRELLPKFERELSPGTRVISCDFPLEGREPERTIIVKRYTLYVYAF
ncbi:MAG: hypothetical protein KGI73_00060 [Patescibacteria group bacterium]|nr:hypothetical protein [Patescibacteria group bacterium]